MPKISEISDFPPIIEWFELSGVNNYKTLRLENQHCIKIIAAENGTGKTTLLNALHAVLSLNLSILSNINFHRLNLKLINQDEIILYRHELFEKNRNKTAGAVKELQALGVTERKLRKNLNYIKQNNLSIEEFTDTPHFNETYLSTSVGKSELIGLYTKLIDHYPNDISNYLARSIEGSLGDISILYLPTFRRIEAEFELEKNKDHTPYRLTHDDDVDSDQLIWFGMNDVTKKLEEYKENIKSITFDSYSTLSAQSLEELLTPSTKRPALIVGSDPEFRSQLNLVLARLGHAGGETEARIYDLIYTGQINEPSYDGLRTHIHRIISIYASTQNQEQLIERFVYIVNSYWQNSIQLDDGPEKEFIFDKLELEVSVKNYINDEDLDLNSLSSGEKQIVAIFAKLYLQQNKKFIILIDEPELSLAIPWQKRLLTDILESPSCAQLIAITHSPFIFDNDLDVYADSLMVQRDYRA